MCPRKSDGETDLEWPTYVKAMEEAASWGGVERLYLHKFGEPLLCGDIARMVVYAKRIGAARQVILTTNGHFLTSDVGRELCMADLDEIRVSLDANTEESYRQVKGVAGLKNVRSNLMTFMDVRRTLNKKRPYVVAKILPLQGTLNEVEGFRANWEGVVDHVAVEGLIHYGERWKRMDVRSLADMERYPCTFLWYTLVVNSDGTLSVCCADWEKKGVVGTVEEGLLRAWHGSGLRKIRLQHLQGNYEFEPCRDCEYWRSRENIGSWLRRQGDKVL